MSIVLYLYGGMALFMDGLLLGVQASECKVDIIDGLEAFFFSAIWPVTIAIYISERVKDVLRKKGGKK